MQDLGILSEKFTVEGLPAGEAVDLEELNRFLDRGRPGKNPLSTARQEAEHTSILRALKGNDAPATPSPDLPRSPEAILQSAITHEEASRDRLQCAARKAQESGFPRAAQTLQRIAETEEAHARRFRRCLQHLQDRTLLEGPRATSWFCLKCGGLHHGCGAPEACEACGSSRGHFIRSDFTPFACG